MQKNNNKSKHDLESTLYWSDFDELGAVWKLATSAFKRHQNRQNRINIWSIRGSVLISMHFWIFLLEFGRILATLKSAKNEQNKIVAQYTEIYTVALVVGTD